MKVYLFIKVYLFLKVYLSKCPNWNVQMHQGKCRRSKNSWHIHLTAKLHYYRYLIHLLSPSVAACPYKSRKPFSQQSRGEMPVCKYKKNYSLRPSCTSLVPWTSSLQVTLWQSRLANCSFCHPPWTPSAWWSFIYSRLPIPITNFYWSL